MEKYRLGINFTESFSINAANTTTFIYTWIRKKKKKKSGKGRYRCFVCILKEKRHTRVCLSAGWLVPIRRTSCCCCFTSTRFAEWKVNRCQLSFYRPHTASIYVYMCKGDFAVFLKFRVQSSYSCVINKFNHTRVLWYVKNFNSLFISGIYWYESIFFIFSMIEKI